MWVIFIVPKLWENDGIWGLPQCGLCSMMLLLLTFSVMTMRRLPGLLVCIMMVRRTLCPDGHLHRALLPVANSSAWSEILVTLVTEQFREQTRFKKPKMMTS